VSDRDEDGLPGHIAGTRDRRLELLPGLRGLLGGDGLAAHDGGLHGTHRALDGAISRVAALRAAMLEVLVATKLPFSRSY
jgi:hypothetical protein